jgi:predicted O-methyltransferase YrrM
MNIIDPELTAYSENVSSPEDDILYRLHRETFITQVNPLMLSGHLQGKFLEIMAASVSARYILDVGTFTGYSAICMARGMQAGGVLHTIDSNPETESVSVKYFTEAGLQNSVKVHIGDAAELIPSLDITFDLIYIDCDKKDYLLVYEAGMQKLRRGGIILADNVLWHGKVADPGQGNDKDTKAIMEFNEYVKNDERTVNVLLPFRDGIMLIYKK